MLLWGAATGTSAATLRNLRERLIALGLSGRDAGEEVHITIATIQDYRLLTETDRAAMNKSIEGLCEHVSHESARVDHLNLVFYAHRSLSKIVWSKTISLKS